MTTPTSTGTGDGRILTTPADHDADTFMEAPSTASRTRRASAATRRAGVSRQDRLDIAIQSLLDYQTDGGAAEMIIMADESALLIILRGVTETAGRIQLVAP